jgi:hypothetical protein
MVLRDARVRSMIEPIAASSFSAGITMVSFIARSYNHVGAPWKQVE